MRLRSVEDHCAKFTQDQRYSYCRHQYGKKLEKEPKITAWQTSVTKDLKPTNARNSSKTNMKLKIIFEDAIYEDDIFTDSFFFTCVNSNALYNLLNLTTVTISSPILSKNFFIFIFIAWLLKLQSFFHW